MAKPGNDGHGKDSSCYEYIVWVVVPSGCEFLHQDMVKDEVWIQHFRTKEDHLLKYLEDDIANI